MVGIHFILVPIAALTKQIRLLFASCDPNRIKFNLFIAHIMRCMRHTENNLCEVFFCLNNPNAHIASVAFCMYEV